MRAIKARLGMDRRAALEAHEAQARAFETWEETEKVIGAAHEIMYRNTGQTVSLVLLIIAFLLIGVEVMSQHI